MRSLVLALAAVTLATACNHHCDFRSEWDGGDPDDEAGCQEYQLFGPDVLVFNATCLALGSELESGTCPEDGIAGGCENVAPDNPWPVITWYYEEHGWTEELVQQQCDDDDEEEYVPAGG